MKTLATRLAWARNRKTWTQGQLADKAGVSQGTIGNLESGARLSSRKIASIAAVLEVDTLWLATGQGEPDTLQPNTIANLSDVALLITIFGKLDPTAQGQVLSLAKTLAKLKPVAQPVAANN